MTAESQMYLREQIHKFMTENNIPNNLMSELMHMPTNSFNVYLGGPKKTTFQLASDGYIEALAVAFKQATHLYWKVHNFCQGDLSREGMTRAVIRAAGQEEAEEIGRAMREGSREAKQKGASQAAARRQRDGGHQVRERMVAVSAASGVTGVRDDMDDLYKDLMERADKREQATKKKKRKKRTS